MDNNPNNFHQNCNKSAHSLLSATFLLEKIASKAWVAFAKYALRCVCLPWFKIKSLIAPPDTGLVYESRGDETNSKLIVLLLSQYTAPNTHGHWMVLAGEFILHSPLSEPTLWLF